MPALPFFGTPTTAAVSRPAAIANFGRSASAAGFGGIVDAIESALGGSVDAWSTHLISLRLFQGTAPHVDQLAMELAAGPQAPKVGIGDEGTLQLSDGGSSVLVFSGAIDGIHRANHGTTLLTASNGSRRLAHSRLNRSFEGRSASEIIEALAQEVRLEIESLAAAEKLPRYVVDDGSSLLDHVARLTAQSGQIACFGGDGKLRVVDPSTNSEVAMRFAYGVDLLDFQLAERVRHTGEVFVSGEGAASDHGSDAWYWLRKDPAPNQAVGGSGVPQRSYRDATLRSPQAVSQRARAALLTGQAASGRGSLVVPGAPQLAPGSRIEISGLSDAALDGAYLIDSVVHTLDPRRGFRTRLRVNRAGAGADALGTLFGAVGGLL